MGDKTKVLLTWNLTDYEWELVKNNWPENLEYVDREKTDDWDKVKVVVGGVSSIEMLDKLPQLKLIQTLGHGINPMGESPLKEELVKRGVKVAKANPAPINISEFVIMEMIALSRRTFLMHSNLAYRGDWSNDRRSGRMQGSLGGELYGSTLGILGFGNIGKAIYERARVFGMDIATLSSNPDRLKEEYELSYVGEYKDLHKLLGMSDYVVVSLPLTDDTRGMIDKECFEAMKDGSYFINIGRGPIVVEEALYEALKDGKLAGAGIDVWEVEEMNVAREYPLPYPIHQYNVIMTPHYCGATKQSRERAIFNAGENITLLLNNEPLKREADLTRGF